MSYYKTITDYASSNGAMPLLYSIRDNIPFAFESLTFVIFLILAISQYFLIKARTTRSKIFVAMLSSSFFMIIISLFLAMSQLVTFMTVIFYAFLCIVTFIAFEVSENS